MVNQLNAEVRSKQAAEESSESTQQAEETPGEGWWKEEDWLTVRAQVEVLMGMGRGSEGGSEAEGQGGLINLPLLSAQESSLGVGVSKRKECKFLESTPGFHHLRQLWDSVTPAHGSSICKRHA